MIDAFTSLPHYAAHLRPVWDALPPELRGTWATRRPPRTAVGPVMVASWSDARAVAPRPVVYVEHGAGQTYRTAGREVGGYSGGPGLERAVLFICPSEVVADRWRARYDAPAVAVGCPRLDQHHDRGHQATGAAVGSAPGQSGTGPTVAVAWHWSCGVAPESRWALPHYRRHLALLVAAVRAAGGRVVGHGHPRAWGVLRPLWAAMGVPAVRDLDDVLAVADLFIADNTSAGYEAAAVGVRTLALNAPWYRRDVDHGLRFWSHPFGPMVDDGDELLDRWADPDTPADAAIRASAVACAYAAVDGQAAARAAAAVARVLG